MSYSISFSFILFPSTFKHTQPHTGRGTWFQWRKMMPLKRMTTTIWHLLTFQQKEREEERGRMDRWETEGKGGRGSVYAIFVIHFFLFRYIVLCCCYIVVRCCGTIFFLRHQVHRFDLGPHDELKCSLSHVSYVSYDILVICLTDDAIFLHTLFLLLSVLQ